MWSKTNIKQNMPVIKFSNWSVSHVNTIQLNEYSTLLTFRLEELSTVQVVTTWMTKFLRRVFILIFPFPSVSFVSFKNVGLINAPCMIN